MDSDNRWVKKAETSMPANPLRMALGSLLIQKLYDYFDGELVEQITENPYYQYFIGLPGFSNEAPYVPSLLVEFRKRLDDEILVEINEMIIAYNAPDDFGLGGGGKTSGGLAEGFKNSGTIILDATCAPQTVSYPEDVNLLNEARENLETLIDRICSDYNYYKSRMYRNNARRDYFNMARCRKRTSKKVRRAIKKQL